MLMDLNDGSCEVVTGIALVHPILVSPGYDVKCVPFPFDELSGPIPLPY